MQEIIVMKFGGASVATPANFHQIAAIIAKEKEDRQTPIVVVISAMANATDQLFSLAKEVHPNPPKRELDMLVSVGERISIALLAMALSLKGVEAVSFTGSQSGMVTDESHNEAKIVDVRPHRLMEALKKGKVVIVAGFQGVSSKGEITTLGRGGSDTSAVALAVALGAKAVDFYKDVGGIYQKDPKFDPEALLCPWLSYAQALFLVKDGAKVLHPRSISLAEKNRVLLHIRSFHSPENIGTVVGDLSIKKPMSVAWEV